MEGTAETTYRETRRAHWDGVARSLRTWRGWGGGYLQRLIEIYRFLIPSGARVLEVGCGTSTCWQAYSRRMAWGSIFRPKCWRSQRSGTPT